MLELDGSAGGGQLLRSALTLSVLTGRPFRMTAIRDARPNPGLRPQHRAAIEAVAGACDADVSGAAVDSRAVTFRPGALEGGEVAVDIGTAGSVALLFDALLALALRLDDPFVAAARGGTDVKWSPTMGYYRGVKLPLLRRHGLAAALDHDRAGFYPAGGGTATLRLWPSSMEPLSLSDRGAFEGTRIHSKASMDLADREVAERQAAAAAEGLREAGLDPVERTVAYAETDSPGSALAVRADYGSAIAGFDALGERGKPAEDVAAEAVAAAREFADGTAAVDGHMADQLVVFLALVGGRVRVPRVTDHVETSIELLRRFGFEVSLDRSADGPVLVG